jgi:hypothetical protein
MVTYASAGTERLLDQMARVLDPLAVRCRGEDRLAVRAEVARAWYDEFQVSLPEPTLSRCASAIGSGQPWRLALWTPE